MSQLALILDRHEKRDLEWLRPIVERIGHTVGREGFTIDTIKRAAGLPMHSSERELSWLGAVPRHFKLVNTGRTRYNDQRNRQVVWVLPEYGSER